MSRQELFHTFFSLWKHPGAGREEILAFQNRKIRHLLSHACRNVGYYQRLFDRSGIEPEDILTVQDLGRIPITERNDLRACSLDELLAARSARPDKLVCRITSGSCGRPFVVRRTKLEEHVVKMFRLRAERQYGLRRRDRIAGVTATVIPGQKSRTSVSRLRKTTGVYRRYPVDCLQPAETVCRLLEELNPDIITGYPSAIAHVAALADGKFNNRKLRHIVCGGESLTPMKRESIKQGFGARVFDVFGAHECHTVAWECPETGLYHVCDDNIIAEVVRDGHPVEEGEKGELVITSLHSYVMPFIRYRMGDIVVKGPQTCPCGQPFSTFRNVEGRVREYFILPDGRQVHPLEVVLPVITEMAPWLNQFQMTQETGTRFVLRVTVLRKPAEQELQTLREIVIHRLGPGAEFQIELVDSIPFEASGKFKDCRSLIQPEDEGGLQAPDQSSKIMKKDNINGLEIATFSSSGLEQHCITAHSSVDRIPSVMESLANTVSEKNAGLLAQTVFAPPGISQDALRHIEAALEKPTWPITWIEHPNGCGEGMFGSQAYAVSGYRVQPLEIDGKIVGSVFESSYARFCLLGNITASDLSLPNSAQAREVFEKIDLALQTVDMTFHNCIRTWFYLEKILSWYTDFNKVRNTFFAEHGMSRGRIPASTAVGASNPSGAAITAGAIAIQPMHRHLCCLQEVESPLQCPAMQYRNIFSRAMEVTLPDCRCLYISGTASIDRDGATAHVGEVDKQIDLTMTVIQGILASRGMNWTDITRATAYFKNMSDVPRLRDYIQRKGLPVLPLAITQADICREDLLFEVEADAVAGT